MNLFLTLPGLKILSSSCLRECRRLGLSLALLTLFTGSPVPARASRIQAAVVVGVVKSINRAAKTFTLQPIAPGAAFRVQWNRQTRFVRQGQKAGPDDLPEGTRVALKYHSPLFGSRYATDVEWQ